MKVAMLELIPATPSLPNKAVNAAKKAEPRAKKTQEGNEFINSPYDVETLFSHRGQSATELAAEHRIFLIFLSIK
jgi:hypothetical protein